MPDPTPDVDVAPAGELAPVPEQKSLLGVTLAQLAGSIAHVGVMAHHIDHAQAAVSAQLLQPLEDVDTEADQVGIHQAIAVQEAKKACNLLVDVHRNLSAFVAEMSPRNLIVRPA